MKQIWPYSDTIVKTLHLTNAWHPASGGIATFYRALIAAANERQHLIRLVVPAEKTWIEEVGRFGRIYHLEAPRAPFNRNYRVLWFHRHLLPNTAIHKILASERPDLVEVCDKYSLNHLAGLIHGRWIPGLRIRPKLVALSCERMDDNVAAYVSRGQIGKWFSRKYMKYCYFRRFDHHITVSEYTAAELRLAAHGERLDRAISVRPMGVDLNRFSIAHRSPAARRELIKKVGGDDNTVLLLYAGRLVPEKNLELLVGTIAELAGDRQRDYRLLIAGDGNRAAWMRRRCEQYAPGHVAFHGHVASRQDLAALYANSDMFVHPNPREPFGIAPLEAMASRLPLVLPNVGGVTTYANSNNAWIADPTPSRFAAGVRAVVSDPVDREARVQAALSTVAALSWPSAASSFLELYERIHTLANGATVETISELRSQAT